MSVLRKLGSRIPFALSLLLAISLFASCCQPAKHEAEMMFQRAKTRFSPADVQTASAAVRLQYPTNCDVPIKNLPREILSLSPEVPASAFVVYRASQKEWELNVRWGGGAICWGIIVCPKGNKIDPTPISADLIRWSDGVFFFSKD
jgi:hypothetical protein